MSLVPKTFTAVTISTLILIPAYDTPICQYLSLITHLVLLLSLEVQHTEDQNAQCSLSLWVHSALGHCALQCTSRDSYNGDWNCSQKYPVAFAQQGDIDWVTELCWAPKGFFFFLLKASQQHVTSSRCHFVKCEVARRWNQEPCRREKSSCTVCTCSPNLMCCTKIAGIVSPVSGNLSCCIFGKVQLSRQYQKECAVYAFHIWLHYIYRISCIIHTVWHFKRQKLHFLFFSFFASTFSTGQEIYLLTHDIKISENAGAITVFQPI